LAETAPQSLRERTDPHRVGAASGEGTLRILHIAGSMPNDWGGIERYVLTLARAQAELEHIVTVAGVPDSPLINRVRVEAPNVLVRPQVTRSKYDLKAVMQLRELMASREYDVAVTHFSPDYLVAGWAARWSGFGGLLMTRHLVIPFKPGRARAYARQYQGFLGVSQASAESLLASGLNRRQVMAAPFGCAGLLPSNSAGIGWGPRTFGIFGRLVDDKGVHVAIDALRRMEEEAELHIFGRGPAEASLRALAGDLVDEPRKREDVSEPPRHRKVIFHGYTEGVADAMAMVGAVILPSVWEEAFSVALLEAMSLGKPIIASRVGGVPDAVTDDEHAWLVPKNDPAALARSMDAMIRIPESGAALGRAARGRWEREFTPERGAIRVTQAYRELLNRR
jgi:glycosyltransferase involved in cell wall biosynthesis